MSDLLILILILLAIAFIFQVDLIYYFVYVCLGVFLTSQLITPRIIRNIELGRIFNHNAFLGEHVQIRLRVMNTSRLPIPWLQVVESVPPALMSGQPARRALTFRSRETKQISYHVRTMKRGYYRIGPLRISAGDYFGLREISAKLPADYLTVYPRIIPLSQLGLPSRLPYGTVPSRQRLFEDPARSIGIREYRSGDSIRHINWKVSAHTDALLVRTFEPAISLETLLLLNLNSDEYSRRNRYDGPEWAIVVAASLAAHFIENRQAVGLWTNGIDPLARTGEGGYAQFEEESGRLQLTSPQALETTLEPGTETEFPTVQASIPPKRGKMHLMKVLERLARIESQENVPFHFWLSRACSNLSWGLNVIAISPSGDEATCAALHQLVQAGYSPVLIVIEPYSDFRNIRRRAAGLGFRAFHTGQERDLDKWRQPRMMRKAS